MPSAMAGESCGHMPIAIVAMPMKNVAIGRGR
jgi:hypothetical protein